MAFDPDAFLATRGVSAGTQTTRTGFDPDAFLSSRGLGGFAASPTTPPAPDLGGMDFGTPPQDEFQPPDPRRMLQDQVAGEMAPDEEPVETFEDRRQKIGKLRAKYIDYAELLPFLDELEADDTLDFYNLEKEFLYAVAQRKQEKAMEKEQTKLAEKAAKEEERRYEKYVRDQQRDAEKQAQQEQKEIQQVQQKEQEAVTETKKEPAKSAFSPWEQERMAQEFIAQDEARQFQETIERQVSGITDPVQADMVAEATVKIEALREAIPNMPAGQQMQAKALLAKMIGRRANNQQILTTQEELFWQNAIGASEAAGRAMRETAVPTTVGAGAGIAATRALAAKTHPAVGIVLGFGAGITAALGAAKAQAEVQKSVLGEEDFARYQQKLAEDREKYPTAVFAGEQLPSLLVGKVNAKELKSAVSAAKAIISGRSAAGLSNEQIVALYNAAFGGTLGAGQEVARGLKEGDVKWTEVAAAAILNSVINDTRFGAPVKAKADTLSVTPDAKIDLDKEATKALDAFAGSIKDTEAAAPVVEPTRPVVEPTTDYEARLRAAGYDEADATRAVQELRREGLSEFELDERIKDIEYAESRAKEAAEQRRQEATETARRAREDAETRRREMGIRGAPEQTVRLGETTYNFRGGEWYREGSTIPVKSATMLRAINEEASRAVQIRETETLPVGERAEGRPPVDREVREQAPPVEGKVAEAEVTPPAKPVEAGAVEAETPGYKAARDPLIARATELGLDTKGTNAEIQARVTKKEKFLSLLDKVEQAARDDIELLRKTSTVGANKPIGLAADYTIIGATKIARGAVNFASWSKEMIKEFGETIRPYLREIYGRSIALNKKDFDSVEAIRDEAVRISKGLTMPKVEVPEGMHLRKTVARAAKPGSGMEQEAAEAIITKAAFAENTPVKKIAEDAEAMTERDPFKALEAIKAETDPKRRVAMRAGYLNNRMKKGEISTEEFNRFAEDASEAGATLRAVREMKLLTPEGRADLALKGFIRFADKKKAKISDQDMATIRQKFTEAEKMELGEAQEAALKKAVDFAISKVRLRAWDLFDAYRYTNALSSPRTHMRNVYENTFNVFVTRPGALIAGGRGKETAAYVKGAVKSVGEAAENFMSAWKQSYVRSTDDITSAGVRDMFEQAYTDKKIPKVLQVIPKFLEAQDKFLSTLIRGGERDRLIRKGWTPEKADVEAARLAEELLYRSRLGETTKDESRNLVSRAIDSMGEWTSDLRKKAVIGKPASLFVLFVRTPFKIAERSAELSPFGFLTPPRKATGGKYGLSKDGLSNAKFKKAYSKLSADQQKLIDETQAELVGRATLGTAVMGAGTLLAAAGRTTFSSPSNEEERREWYATGRKPYSIKIGDTWVPARYFGPLGLSLMIPAALRDWTAERPERMSMDVVDRVINGMISLQKYFMEETPMLGTKNFLDTIMGGGQVNREGLKTWTQSKVAGFTATQLIPLSSALRYINAWADRDFRNPDGFVEEVMSGIPFLSKDLAPILDAEGEPVQRTIADILPPFSVGLAKDETKLKEMRSIRERQIKMRRDTDLLLKDYKRGNASLEDIVEFMNAVPEDLKRMVRTRLRAADPKIKEVIKLPSETGGSGLGDELKGGDLNEGEDYVSGRL